MNVTDNTYTIVGQQANIIARGGYRNRYAGVNTHGKACVLTMGEQRTLTQRVYFNDLNSAKAFFEKFAERFSDRNIDWAIKKVSKNNGAYGAELFEHDSEFGKILQASEAKSYADIAFRGK